MPEDSETFFDKSEETEKVSEVVEGSEEKSESEGPETGDKKEETEEQFVEGTTFKNVQDLAKAYKELQGNFTRTSQSLAEAKDVLKQLAPLLTKSQQKEAKKEVEDDPDAFMKKFVSDPLGTLRGLINETQKSIITPLQGEVRAASASLELNQFLAKHTELTESDVESFLKIMDAYPEVMGRKDRLEVWLKLLKTDNPEIGQRTTQQKESLEQGVSDAKKAAGLGSRKSSTPKQPEGDEFDEVLKLYNERRSKF